MMPSEQVLYGAPGERSAYGSGILHQRKPSSHRRIGGIVQRGSIGEYLGSITLADVVNVRMIGFALTRAWTYVMFFSTVVHYSVRNDISHLNSTDTWSSLGLAVLMVGSALLSKQFIRLVLGKRWVTIAVPAALLAATALLALIEADWFRQPWCSIICTVTGVGLGVLYLAWGEAYTRIDETKTAVEAMSSFLLAAIIFPIVILLPRIAGVATAMLLLLASAYILFGRLGVWKKARLLGSVQVNKSGFLIKALLSVGILGFAESLMRALFLEANPVVDVGLYPWVFLAAALLSAAVISITVFSEKKPDFAFAYKVILFVTAFIFLLLPIIDRGTFLANVLALTGYSTLSLLVWVVLARTASRYHLSSVVVFGFGWGLMVAGGLGGTFLGGLLTSFVDLTPRMLSFIALLSVCALLFAYLFLFNERSIVELTAEKDSQDDSSRPFRRRCEEVAKSYKLSAKETEVMILVAKGRSTPRICEELDISQGTVNTHLTHPYKKLDVHDKQQLLDVLEGRPTQ